jgi:hypothetical protein
MQAITTIGLDIAKSVFQVHGIDAEGNVGRPRLRTLECELLREAAVWHKPQLRNNPELLLTRGGGISP